MYDIKTLPPQEYLRERLDYDAETGVLRWRGWPASGVPTMARRWESNFAGRIAGHKTKSRERRVFLKIDDVNYYAHRVIWKWMTGDEPPQIDHRDVDGTNNRWANLRIVDCAQNSANRKTQKNNKHGKGVWKSQRGKYVAAISVRRTRIWLGTFVNVEDARAAYRDAAQRFHGEFAGPD